MGNVACNSNIPSSGWNEEIAAAQVDTAKTLFVTEGNIAAAVNYAHIRVDIELVPLMKELTQLKVLIDVMKRSAVVLGPETSSGSRVLQLVRLASDAVAGMLSDLMSLTDAFTSVSEIPSFTRAYHQQREINKNDFPQWVQRDDAHLSTQELKLLTRRYAAPNSWEDYSSDQPTNEKTAATEDRTYWNNQDSENIDSIAEATEDSRSANLQVKGEHAYHQAKGRIHSAEYRAAFRRQETVGNPYPSMYPENDPSKWSRFTSTPNQSVLSSANTSTALLRPKRTPLLVLAGVALIGCAISSIVSYFTTAALIGAVQAKQSVIISQVEDNLIRTNQNSVDIERITAAAKLFRDGQRGNQKQIDMLKWETVALWAMDVVNDQTRRVNRLTDAAVAAYANRLNPGLVETAGLMHAIQTLNSDCLARGRQIAITTVAQVYQLQTSFLFDPDIDTFHLVIHVPIYKPAHVMRLYRHIPLPLACSVEMGCSDKISIELAPRQTYLAVNRDNTLYKSFTETELARCHKLGESRFCDSPVFTKEAAPDCLAALFRNNRALIRSRCPAIVTAPTSRFLRLNRTYWIVSDPDRLHVTTVCADNTYSSWIQGVTQLRLEEGCTISSDKWIITRDAFEPDVTMTNYVVDTGLTVQMLAPNLTKIQWDVIEETISSIGTPVENIEQLDIFRQKIAAAEAHSAWLQLIHTAFSTTMMTALISVAAAIIAYYCYQRQRRSRMRRLVEAAEMRDYAMYRDQGARPRVRPNNVDLISELPDSVSRSGFDPSRSSATLGQRMLPDGWLDRAVNAPRSINGSLGYTLPRTSTPIDIPGGRSRHYDRQFTRRYYEPSGDIEMESVSGNPTLYPSVEADETFFTPPVAVEDIQPPVYRSLAPRNARNPRPPRSLVFENEEVAPIRRSHSLRQMPEPHTPIRPPTRSVVAEQLNL
jgi:hypothetical protein